MHGPISDNYWKVAITEVETLEAINSWEVVDCAKDMNVLLSTWSFKLKHFPNELIKAWFCARRDQQIEDIDFFETYAPVLQ